MSSGPGPNKTWVRKKCGAILTSKKADRPDKDCQNWALRGGVNCWQHTVDKREVEKKADLAAAHTTIQRNETRRKAVLYGLPQDVTPTEALLQELARTQGHVLWLAGKVADIVDEKDLLWGKIEQTTRSGDDEEHNWDETKYSAAENNWLRMYKAERFHLVHVANTITKLGIAEAYVRVAAAQAQMFETALLTILDGAGVDKADPAIRALVAATMRQLSTAQIALDVPDQLPGRRGEEYRPDRSPERSRT